MLSSYLLLLFAKELVRFMTSGVTCAVQQTSAFLCHLCHLCKLNNPTDDPLHLIWEPKLVELLTPPTLSLFSEKYLYFNRIQLP